MELRRCSGLATNVGYGITVAVLIFLFSAESVRAAQAGVAVAGANIGEAETVPNSCFDQVGITPFDAFRHVRRCIQDWTEYNVDTCAPISPGSYSILVQPKHGTISTAILGPYPLKNGDCPNNTYMFNFAFYNWTDDRENYDCTDAPRACDLFTLEWYTPDHCCYVD